MNSYLNIDYVSMTFPTDSGPLTVLEDINFKVNKGEFISLIGHSGCGKSTVLNIVAGLLTASKGGILLENKEVNEPGPDAAVIFQNHSLLPWLSVYDNVRLAVDQVFKKTKSRKERDEWVRHNLNLVHMSHALDRRPDEISGGMKQRVGIARALAMEPKVLLMDEPFGALDSLTRTHMQDSLMEIQANLNNTVMMITHDVDEAILLSDRIVMMTNGPNAKIGEILDVELERPRDRLALTEDPKFNHYRAEVVKFLHERHQNQNKNEGNNQSKLEKSKSNNSEISKSKVVKSHTSNKVLEKHKLEIGFIPLTDCAPLVIAKEKGFFAKQGLDVRLSRESSWANIRDKVCADMLDGAQMLAAMPLMSIFNNYHCEPMVTSISLGLNGNAITVSKELYRRMLTTTDERDLNSAMGSALAFKKVIEQDKAVRRLPMTFAVVFPQSSHNYLLRYWMSSVSIDPDKDVRIIVVPPPKVGHYLRAGIINGCCVGEPWNSHAVSEGLGQTLITSYDIWNNHPEKVFAVTRNWAQCNPNTHQAVLIGIIEACEWLDLSENRREACELISVSQYVNVPVDVLKKSMTGTLQIPSNGTPRIESDYNVFHRYATNFPWRSHALWFLSQMQRWGEIDDSVKLETIAKSVYRPEAYRAACYALNKPCPEVDFKSEGLHKNGWSIACKDENILMGSDQFMDGRVFYPDRVEEYLSSFSSKQSTEAEQITV